MVSQEQDESDSDLTDNEDIIEDCQSIKQISIAMDQMLENDKSRETSPQSQTRIITQAPSIMAKKPLPLKSYKRPGLEINTEISKDFSAMPRPIQTESYSSVRFDFSGIGFQENPVVTNNYPQRYSMDEQDYFVYT